MVLEQSAFFDKILADDEISWKSIILESVKSGDMDPWDVDISYIATKFLDMLKSLQEMNLKIGGKVILTSALLLKLKSKRFLDHDVTQLDALIASTEDEEYDEFMDEDGEYLGGVSRVTISAEDQLPLQKRTPLARKRKVSVYDLIDALEQALEVSKRRQIKQIVNAPDVVAPSNPFDLSASMDDLYRAVTGHLAQKEVLNFSQLIPSGHRDDKIMTFIPLLHLRNARKIDLHQEAHFGDFEISKFDARKELDEELSE